MNPTTYDTTWDSSNDYSYGDLISFEDDNDAAAITKKITAYVDGDLVWGVEPDGKTPAVTTTTTETENPVSTTTTTSVIGSQTTADEELLYGDVNVDGKVNLVDAVMLNKAVSDTITLNERGRKNADCDVSGEINGNDALILLRFLVKLEDVLPVTQS